MQRGLVIGIIKSVVACIRNLFCIAVHLFQAGTKKRTFTDVCHTIGNDDDGKIVAVVERYISYARHAIWNNDLCQVCTIRERTGSYARHAVGN